MDLHLTLQPKQQLLDDQIHDRRPGAPTVLFFGGARGGAKSGGVRRVALKLAIEAPVISWIVRRVWDDLNKDHVQPLFREFSQLMPFWRAGDKELRLPNGSSIFFIHAGDAGRQKRKARGPQAHYIFVDQAEEFTQQEIERWDGSNRAPGTPPGFCKKILLFNPGGVGTAYLRRVAYLRKYMDNEDPTSFGRLIHAYGWDNYEWFRGMVGAPTEREFYEEAPWSDEMPEPIPMTDGGWPAKPSHRFTAFVEQTDYGQKLKKLSPSERIGELMGSFEKYAGQYYADVWEEGAIVLPSDLASRIIQPWWRRWLATDWGFSHYAATGWFTAGLLSPEQVSGHFGIECATTLRIIVMYRELVVSDCPEPLLAQTVASMTPPAERRECKDYWLSPDAWAKRGGGNTVSEQIEPILLREGMPRLSQAKTDRVGGWRLLYNCWGMARKLRRWSGAQPFRQMPEDPPCLFISSQCPEVAKAVPMLICEENDPQDVRKVPGAVEDDVADMIRYGMKSYLDAETNQPYEVTAQETWEKYQDPTSRAMAMRKLAADQSRGQLLRRKRPA